ncbi:Hypothetical predicted protein, partial [Mytilus galloprovincialis]
SSNGSLLVAIAGMDGSVFRGADSPYSESLARGICYKRSRNVHNLIKGFRISPLQRP